MNPIGQLAEISINFIALFLLNLIQHIKAELEL